MPQPINRWNYTERGVETTFNDTYRGRQNKKYTASNMKMNQGFASVRSTFPQGSFMSCRFPDEPHLQRQPHQNNWHAVFISVSTPVQSFYVQDERGEWKLPVVHNTTGTKSLPPVHSYSSLHQSQPQTQIQTQHQPPQRNSPTSNAHSALSSTSSSSSSSSPFSSTSSSSSSSSSSSLLPAASSPSASSSSISSAPSHLASTAVDLNHTAVSDVDLQTRVRPGEIFRPSQYYLTRTGRAPPIGLYKDLTPIPADQLAATEKRKPHMALQPGFQVQYRQQA